MKPAERTTSARTSARTAPNHRSFTRDRIRTAHVSKLLQPVHSALSKLLSAFEVQGRRGKVSFSIGGIERDEHKFCGTVVSKQRLSRGWHGVGIVPSTDTHLIVKVFWLSIVLFSSNGGESTRRRHS